MKNFIGERKQAELTWKRDSSYIIADSLNNVGCESSWGFTNRRWNPEWWV